MYKRFVISIFLLFTLGGLKAQYTKLLDFAGTTNGENPLSSLFYDGATYLYGMTNAGGVNNGGTIFKIKTNGTGDTVLYNAPSGVSGYSLMSNLISDGTYLYGMSGLGGVNDKGVIFKMMPNGSGYLKLHDFAGGTTDGAFPNGSLTYDGTYLYGMALEGGASNKGVIFKIKPDGTGYVDLLDFNGTTNGGSSMGGSLLYDGTTYLYGMTSGGGASNAGLVFKIKTDGSGYVDLLDFNTTNGRIPNGTLVSDGIYLYGMTGLGGANFDGVIFKVKTDGTRDTVLLNFTGANGASPINNSIIYDGNFLYGMTQKGGANDSGTIFRIKPDGTGYTDLFDFNGASGYYPNGSLISDGTYLYGMTQYGGADSMGVVFKYNYSTVGINQLSENKEQVIIYPHPVSSSSTLSFSNQNHLKFCLDIYTNNGIKVASSTTNSDSFILQKQGFADGIYFYHLYSVENNFSIYNKIIFIN